MLCNGGFIVFKIDGVNHKAVNAGQLLIIAGIISILIDIFLIKTEKGIWISIGCSLLASGIVVLLQALLVDVKKIDYAEEWGLVKIYKHRSDKSDDSEPKLDKAKHHLDAVAFGLKSFRTVQTKRVAKLLKNGVDVRLLTMNPSPDNIFLKQREIEENEVEGQIRKSIEDLVKWADTLNKNRKSKGKIVVKGYKCMTLDFYWRVDDEIYIGPYWFGFDSQQTITYKFVSGKQGFELYTDYFEQLWNNNDNTVILTEYKGEENG